MPSHFKFLNTVLIALCVANGVLSIPLELEPIAAASTTAEQANEASLNTANNLANKNILKMEHVLNNPTAPGHQDMIDAAFGTDPSLDMNEVKNTVQTLKTGKVPVSLTTAKGNGVIAYTNYDTSTDPMTPTHVEFGKKYFAKGTSDDARAATLVHEATHKLKDTGDYIKDGQVLNGGDPEETRQTGYATGMEPKKSAAALNADTNWAKMRDGHAPTFGDPVPATKELHKNAESYGQFSAMCGAAVSDAAVGLRRRALAAGNYDEAALYLVRRQACSIRNRPASAKKAADAKAAAATKSKSLNAKSADAKSKSAASRSKSKSTKASDPLRKVANGRVAKTNGKKRLSTTSTAAKKAALGGSKAKGSKTAAAKKAAKKAALGGAKAKGSKGTAAKKAAKKTGLGASKVGGSKAKKSKTAAAKKGALGASKVGGKSKGKSTAAKKAALGGAKKAKGAKGLAKGAKALGAKGAKGGKGGLAKGAAKGLAKGAKKAAATKRPARKQIPVKSSKAKVVMPKSKNASKANKASKALKNAAPKGANNKKNATPKGANVRTAVKKNNGNNKSKNNGNNNKSKNNGQAAKPKKQTKQQTNLPKVNPQRAAAKGAEKMVNARPAPQRQNAAKSPNRPAGKSAKKGRL